MNPQNGLDETLAQFEVCRTCANCFLTSEMEFEHIFEFRSELKLEMEFVQRQLRDWQIKVHESDDLPQRICASCFTKFCSVDAFRVGCEEAQRKLIATLLDDHITQETDALPMNDFLSIDSPVKPELIENLIDVEDFKGRDSDAVVHMNGDALTDFNVFQQNQLAHLQNGHLVDATDNDFVAPQLMAVQANDALAFMPSVNAQNIYFEQTAANGAANEEPAMSEDLEEVLQSNIIATKANKAEVESMKAALKQVKISRKEESDDNINTSDDDEEIDTVATRLLGTPFACQYCYCSSTGPIDHLVFPTSDALSQHFFDVHDPNQPYNCPFCAQAFKASKQRDNHVRLQHTAYARKDQCEYCRKRLRGPVEMHQYSCPYVGDWECDICGEKFPGTPLHRFRHHQRQHDPVKQYNCSVCNRTFVRRANMESHERLHKTQSDLLVACDECKEAFSSDYELKRHKYQAHNGDLPAKCDYCSKGFVSIAFLRRHIRNFHPEKLDASNENAFKCTNCNTVFTSLHKLRFHLQRPRDENGKCIDPEHALKEKRRVQRQGLFPCSFCPKRFHLKWQQEKHLNTHDARLRPYPCEICSVRCRTTFELKQHINSAHLNIKPFECDTCGKRFGCKKNLQDHMLYHTDLKICCPEIGCNYMCKGDKAIADHIRLKHLLVRCEYCGDSFTRQQLRIHLRKEHRAEIDVEIQLDPNFSGSTAASETVTNNGAVGAEDSTSQSFNTNHKNKAVHVEPLIPTTSTLLETSSTSTATTTIFNPLQEQSINTFKPLMVPNEEIEQYFMGSIMDPDHEIIVT